MISSMVDSTSDSASAACSSSASVVVLAKLNRTVPHSPSPGVPIASITFDSLNAPLEHADPEEAQTPRSDNINNINSLLIEGNEIELVVQARRAPEELICTVGTFKRRVDSN